jgi:hypothetical protein
MRYKVKAASDASYRDLFAFLSRTAKLSVASPRRRLLAVDHLTEDMQEEIRSRGGRIVEDREYDIERPGR